MDGSLAGREANTKVCKPAESDGLKVRLRSGSQLLFSTHCGPLGRGYGEQMVAMMVVLSAISGSPDSSAMSESAPGKPTSYIATVGFSEGKCSFWTGDVSLDADGFRDDLKDRFDVKQRIIIFHAISVPQRCVSDAREAASAAGFKDIESEVGSIDIGPPH